MNQTHWQYYGTADTTGNLTLTWQASVLPTEAVTIELWGYEETGEAKGWTDRGALLACRVGSLGLAEAGERESHVRILSKKSTGKKGDPGEACGGWVGVGNP